MAAIKLPAAVTEGLDALTSAYDKLSTPQKYAVGAVGGVVSLALVNQVLQRSRDYKRKPSSFELGGGSIDASKVQAEFDAYSDAYGKDPSVGIKDR